MLGDEPVTLLLGSERGREEEEAQRPAVHADRTSFQTRYPQKRRSHEPVYCGPQWCEEEEGEEQALYQQQRVLKRVPGHRQ